MSFKIVNNLSEKEYQMIAKNAAKGEVLIFRDTPILSPVIS